MHNCPECGQKVQDLRSLLQNRLFHHLMEEAFLNWPAQSKFRPENKDHLKAYLLVKAKHSVTERIDVPEGITPVAISSVARGVLRAIKQHAFIKMYAGEPYFDVSYPKPTRFGECSPKDFSHVFDEVMDIINTDYIPGFKREHVTPELKKLPPNDHTSACAD